MTASVRLSVKTVRAMLSLCLDHAVCLGHGSALSFTSLAEVERALRPSEKKKLVRKANKSARETKTKSKRDETAALYKQVERRAGGHCEMCLQPFTDFDPPHLDHAIARGKAYQELPTVWLIHMLCHRRKHASDPAWMYSYRSHCERHRYDFAWRWVEGQIVKVRARSALSERREGA